MSYVNDATVWTCDYCNHQEYNGGDWMPSGWIAVAISNENATLYGVTTRHLCHKCVDLSFVGFMEFLIEKA